MLQHLINLYELQSTDARIHELQEQIKAVPETVLTLSSKVDDLRERSESLLAERDSAEKEQKVLEGSVKAEGLKIKKWEARLAEIRNQREALALSRETDGSKRAKKKDEESILELMAKREEQAKAYEALQDELAENEVDLESAEEERTLGNSDSEKEIVTLTARREELAPNIDKKLIRKYDLIRKKRMGIGLVLVADGHCQGCNIRLPPQLFNVLQRGDSIEQCPSCQRLILWNRAVLDKDKDAEGAEQKEAEAAS
ncbi:hypothetical protein KAI87_05960 [Myxococcota bacterium]|nr:hypothetical protein [Myxococcota bacterium]